MAQPIRSGFRDANPGDFGTGQAIKQLDHLRDRKDFKNDRDFRVKLEDTRYVDDLMMKRAAEGNKDSDEAILKARDELAAMQDKSGSVEYRQKKTELYGQIAQSNANHAQFMDGSKLAIDYATKNAMYMNPGALADLNTSIENRDPEGIKKFYSEGINHQKIIAKSIQDGMKVLSNSYDVKSNGDYATVTGQEYNPIFYKEGPNGTAVAKSAEDFNDGAQKMMMNQLPPTTLKYLEDQALERIDAMESDNIPDEDQAFLNIADPEDQIFTMYLEQGLQTYHPSDLDPKTLRLANSNNSYYNNLNKDNVSKEEVGLIRNRNVNSLISNYSNENFRYEFTEADEDGNYIIKRFIKEKDSVGLGMVPNEEQRESDPLIIDMNDESTHLAALNRMRADSKSDKKEVSSGAGETPAIDPNLPISYDGGSYTAKELLEDKDLTQEEIDLLIRDQEDN